MSDEAVDAHIVALIENVKEVDRLRDIHSQITKKGPGRKFNVAALNKSGIVLLVACWEAFVEDLVAGALEHMIGAASSPQAFPEVVLERVAAAYSGKNVWKLARDGWKAALRDNMKGVLAKTTGALNTPKTEQVNQLFERTLGLSGLSASWRWKGRTVSQASKSLDDLISLRGSIAHRVRASKQVWLKDVRAARELLFRLSVKSHNRTSEFLESQVGTTPWTPSTFRGMS